MTESVPINAVMRRAWPIPPGGPCFEQIANTAEITSQLTEGAA